MDVVVARYYWGTESFHSQANSLLRAKVPIGPWPIRSLELSLRGTFAVKVP